MYKAVFCFFPIDEKFKPVGDACHMIIWGKTVEELNKNIHDERDNHNLARFTPLFFESIETE